MATANLYQLQDTYDTKADAFCKEHSINKEVFADLALSWVRANAHWDEESQSGTVKPQKEPMDSEWDV